MTEQLVRDRGTADEHDEAEDQVRAALRRDVEHRREHREEEQRRPEVALAHHDQDRDAPRQYEWPEVLERGKRDAGDAVHAAPEQLAFVDEVRGEEHHEQHLGRLAGLEVQRSDPDPEPRAVDGLADARREREHERHDPEEEERVAVALQRADAAHHDERDHEGGDAGGRPPGLDAREVAVEARDRHEPDTVE